MTAPFAEHLVVEEVTDLAGASAGAVFSPCRRYRYLLWRTWGDAAPLSFIMLNPSTATHLVTDATVRRCIGYAHREQAGGVQVLNLFAYRSTDPAALTAVDDPVGPDNDFMIRHAATESRDIVAAWGHYGSLHDRADRVRDLLRDLRRPDGSTVHLRALGFTNAGEPRHPLYLPKTAPLMACE